MYFTFACPHCKKKLKVRQEAAGRKASCPYCKTSVVVPTPPEEAEADDGLAAFRGIGDSQQSDKIPDTARRQAPEQAPGQAPEQAPSHAPKHKSSGSGWADRTDVSVLRSCMLGSAIGAGFLLLMLPFINMYLGELFFKRGGVPFVLVFLMGWSASILILKSRKLKRQKASMLFDLLPTDLSEEINEDSLDKFVTHIHELPVESSESFLINRVLRGLEHFRVRKSNPEVAGMLASQSEIDANAVQSSYTLLNVFVWAIPILGFVGTVIGISAAVSGFSGSLEAAQDISVLKDSLNNVTGGLATAFDTTLVALVMSMLVMFPSSALQKAEEDLLNWVDEYCNENLLKRLQEGGNLSSMQDTTKIRQAFDSALAPHHAELRDWTEKLKTIGSTLTDQVAAGWSDINKRVEAKQTESAEQIRDLDAMAGAFLKTMTSLARQTETVHQQAAGSMTQSAESMKAYCTALGTGITGLNDVLGQLGEKQVVVHTQPRRGWFSRRKTKG
ncbi:MAG: MotA/TolQ/ExbB proton channel family protein [Planctomycetes bacterium]|nr:MotA/TolQ/ExbB proton channel family protein [Planctomycetota bacterium]